MGTRTPTDGELSGARDWAGLWESGDQPYCGITGAETDGSSGLAWGPGLWTVWGGPWRLGRVSQSVGALKTWSVCLVLTCLSRCCKVTASGGRTWVGFMSGQPQPHLSC